MAEITEAHEVDNEVYALSDIEVASWTVRQLPPSRGPATGRLDRSRAWDEAPPYWFATTAN